MLVMGDFWHQAEGERRMIMGKKACKKLNIWQKNNTHACKKACTKESDSWRKNITCMGEIPNVRRVRVLVIFCKRLKSLKCINIETKVSYRERMVVVICNIPKAEPNCKCKCKCT
jgi:hypothetical protein